MVQQRQYNNNNQQKTIALTLNPNLNRRFYEVKLENYGINVMPEE